jgi:hypothetical protein
MISRAPRRWLCIVIAIGLVGLVFDISLALGPFGPVRPLVGEDGWEQTAGFSRDRLQLAFVDAPRSIAQSPSLVTWRSWSPQTGGMTGELRTAPFLLPDYLAVPYAGFPGEAPGNRIVLRCELDGREMPVASLRTNAQWATVFLRTAGFCSGSARLIASVSDSRFYIAVATPFAVTAAAYHANTQFGPRALVVILTWGVLVVFATCFALLALRVSPAVHPVAAGFAGVGVVGMAVLAAFTVSAKAGISTVLAMTAAFFAGFVFAVFFDRERLRSVAARHGHAALLWLALALAYAGFVSAADSGGGSWATNGLFTPLRWSTDNQLPMLFAEGLLDGTPRATITFGSWLATDRGPLLTALLLIPRVLLMPLVERFGSSFMSIAYMTAGLTILASWAVVLHWFCREAGIRRVWIAALMAIVSPFFLFNTVYTWPKIFGASYVVIAFLVLARASQNDAAHRSAVILAAICAALAYLAHGSNALAVVPLALFFLPVARAAGAHALATGIGAAVLVYLPWAYWQYAIQPDGNALLRYAFTNSFGFDERHQPMWPAIVRAYVQLGFHGWLALKAEDVRLLLGADIVSWEVAPYSPGIGFLGSARLADFFGLVRAVGTALLGLALLAVSRWTGAGMQANSQMLTRAALVGLGGLVFTVVGFFPPAVVHQLPYGSVLLLFLAGAGAVASGPPLLAAVLVPLALGYFLIVWIGAPLMIADRLMASGLAGMGFGVVLFALVLINLQPPHRRADDAVFSEKAT